MFNREELIQYVWAGAIVTDQVVTQSIFELRKLLRDGREENTSYVITVPKRGYKLVANVTPMTLEEFLASRRVIQKLFLLLLKNQKKILYLSHLPSPFLLAL